MKISTTTKIHIREKKRNHPVTYWPRNEGASSRKLGFSRSLDERWFIRGPSWRGAHVRRTGGAQSWRQILFSKKRHQSTIVLLNTVETFGWILHPGESRWPVSGVENETTPSENRAVFDRWEIRKSFIRSSMMVDRFRSWYLINYKPRWLSRDDIRGQDGNEGLIFKSLHVWIAINLLRGNYWKEEKSKIF